MKMMTHRENLFKNDEINMMREKCQLKIIKRKNVKMNVPNAKVFFQRHDDFFSVKLNSKYEIKEICSWGS